MSTVAPEVPDNVAARVFAEPWQAEAFALAVALNQKNAFDWHEWVEVFSGQSGEPLVGNEKAIEAAYYQRWLAALEAIAVGHGLVSTPEVDHRVEEWRRAYLRTPHGQPIELARGLEADAEHEAHSHDHHDHDEDGHVHHHSVRAVPVSISPPAAGRSS